MEFQRRVVVLQVLMYILFLLLGIFSVVRNLFDNNLILYIGIGVLAILLVGLYFIYRLGSTNYLVITEKTNKINKYNLYLYMIGYLLIIVFGNAKEKNMLYIYIVGAILVLSAIFGIILHSRILLKNKVSK